jgi:hypothetical protein
MSEEKSKKLIDLTLQLLEMSEDHERRLRAIEEKSQPEIVISQGDPIRINPIQAVPPPVGIPTGIPTDIPAAVIPAKKESKLNKFFKAKNGKPWYTSAGIWFALFAVGIMFYIIYLFLKSQHFVIPKFHL